MTKSEVKKTHIFWTGGWDSTFRVLQLLMTTDVVVQPHFIIRYEGSTGIEINAMNDIRRMTIRRYPSVRQRFLPTKYINASLIERHADIENQIEEARQNGRLIDPQYDLMANYCREFSIDEIELGVDVFPGSDIEKWHKKSLGGIPAFKSFAYPIWKLTKNDTLQIAKQNDWLDIMSLTSFCRKPIIKVKPCGTCGPCIDTVVTGLDFRLPFRSRIKARIQKPFRQFWRKSYHKNQNHWFYKFVKKKFADKF